MRRARPRRALRGGGAGEQAGADFKPYEDTPASPGFSYEDVPGFRAAADLDAIRDHNHVLIPGQYIGSELVKGDREPLDEKIARLTAGIGGWLYRPPGLRRRHDRAGRWDSLPAPDLRSGRDSSDPC
jgi:hypothetical protein